MPSEYFDPVGVRFRFPIRSIRRTSTTTWAFAPSELTGRARRLFNVMGRLADGATLDQAQAELDAIALGLAEDYGDSNAGWGVTIERAKDLLQEANQHLLILLGAVGFVLLIACANVANLLLARAAEHEREIAIRRALGAGRLSLMRQLLFESLALAVLGGGAALLLSVWGVVQSILGVYRWIQKVQVIRILFLVLI